MRPILFQIGEITVHSFGVMLALGFLVGWIWTRALARRRDVPLRVIDNLFAMVTLGGLLGARAVDVALNPDFYLADPVRLVCIWQGGMALLGGLYGALLASCAYLLRSQVATLRVADLALPGMFLGLAIGRVGSLLMGDDFGTQTDAAWAVRFPDLPGSLLPFPLVDIPLHPTQLYLALNALLLFVLTSLLLKGRHRIEGATFVVGMSGYALARLFLETYRGDDIARGFVGPYAITQWMCAGLLLIALAAAGPVAWRHRSGMAARKAAGST